MPLIKAKGGQVVNASIAVIGFGIIAMLLLPLLANAGHRKRGPKPKRRGRIDIHYEIIQREMQKIFKIIGIAA